MVVMRALLTTVAMLLPLTAAALDGGLPLTSLDDGWLRVEGDQPLVFRWTVDNPFVGVVEAEQAAGLRYSVDDCVELDYGGAPPRARLKFEVASPDAALELDLGEPAQVRLLGAFRDADAIVALLVGSYFCSSRGAENGVRWWTAVQLAPSLAVVEHRRTDRSSSSCWHNMDTRLVTEGGFVESEGHLLMEVEARMFKCYGGSGETWTVRWPLGEAPPCLQPIEPGGFRATATAVGAFVDVATFGPEDEPLGRVFANLFRYPIAFGVALRWGGDGAETFIELPQFDATARLAGYAEAASATPPTPSRDPAVEPGLEGGAYLAADAWPEALAACAAEFRAGVLDRFTPVEWTPLLAGKERRIGLLSIPCQKWQDGEDNEQQRASWLISLGPGRSTPVLAVASCGAFHSAFERYKYQAPHVTVQVQRDLQQVRLLYEAAVEPDRLLAARSARPAQGDLDGLDSRLVASRELGGVAAVAFSLDGLVDVEPATSRWRETWTGRGDITELRWTGEVFTALGLEGGHISSVDGVTWSAAPAPEATNGAEPNAPQGPSLPVWVQGCPSVASAAPRVPVATNGRTVVVAVGGELGEVRAATSCGDVTVSRLPGSYSLNAAIWTGEEFLVAGDGPCKQCTGRLWASPDGMTWRAETVPLGSPLTHLAASPDTLVVGGWGRLLAGPVLAPPGATSKGTPLR